MIEKSDFGCILRVRQIFFFLHSSRSVKVFLCPEAPTSSFCQRGGRRTTVEMWTNRLKQAEKACLIRAKSSGGHLMSGLPSTFVSEEVASVSAQPDTRHTSPGWRSQ